MTVALGIMQVPAPQDGDSIRRYETGTLPDGGLWTALTRVSNHDHTGGLNGKPISVSSIPDGSITTSKLDPSVLAPYALVDGSKPFTGQVALNADAIVRDHLYFGAKPAGVADATLQRTAAGALRVDTNLGVGVNPANWGGASRVAVQVGMGGAVQADTGSATAILSANNGPGNVTLVAGASSLLSLASGGATFFTAPSVAAGATQTFTTRMSLSQQGTLSITPDANGAAVAVAYGSGTNSGRFDGGNSAECYGSGAAALVVGSSRVSLYPPGGGCYPGADNTLSCGIASARWTTLYAVSGAVNGSSADLKTDITPLDPAAAMAAVRATQPVTFDYRPPERDASWYELPDDPEQAEAVLYQRLTAAPLEAGARHQAGFVLGSPDYATDPLFETGDLQSSPQNSVGILIAALQSIDQRLTALETP